MMACLFTKPLRNTLGALWSRTTVSICNHEGSLSGSILPWTSEITWRSTLQSFPPTLLLFLAKDIKHLAEDFEVQAWARDLVEEDPLLGCNIKVKLYLYCSPQRSSRITLIDPVLLQEET